ncbi:MAG: hypothetical protein AAF764_05630 [Pseudomonadota bacterium]
MRSRADELRLDVQGLLAPSGMIPFGWFDVDRSDGEPGKRALLIGNIGSSLWPAFSKSEEANDGQPDPMDRWTRAVVAPIASELKAEARYPFGEPRWPFQTYAKAATGMNNSPLGLLIHPQYGLWTALRAILVFNGDFDAPQHHVDWHPCDRCVEKPCLNTCPVDAFRPEGYDWQGCKAHVASPKGRACLNGGCLARRACPVGMEYAYDDEHQAFHMAAYV